MKEWKKQTGTQEERPAEVDRESSPTTVYLRRDIEQVQRPATDESGAEVTEWKYEEQELTVDEYEQMVLMQQVVTKIQRALLHQSRNFKKMRL